jgi:hypothetical protein
VSRDFPFREIGIENSGVLVTRDRDVGGNPEAVLDRGGYVS